MPLIVNVTFEANEMTGSIPLSLWSLQRIERLLFRHNFYNGSMPNTFSGLRSCSKIDFSQNLLTGNLPSSIVDLEKLTYLDFSINQLTGPIPGKIGNLQLLDTLNLFMNNLNGTIPESLFSISTLSTIDFSLNNISGNISSSISNIQFLTVFDLSYNYLKGTIPSEIISLKLLKTLSLNKNELTGTILSDIGSLKSLTNCLLNNNKLHGSIPDSVYSLENLISLSLVGNSLTGTLSQDISQLTAIQYLMLSDNFLNGSLPDFSSNSRMLDIVLSNNQFTGTIPDVSGLYNLFLLELNGNALHTSIPDSFCLTKSLSDIELSDNQLTGTIPACFGATSMPLMYLYASNNFLEGTLPNSFNNFTNGLAEGIVLNNNLLSGTIPSDQSKLSKFMSFYEIGHNMFTGTIPAYLSTFELLVELNLEHNRFHGTLPPLKTQRYLETLFINDNYLTGRLDDAIVLVSDNMRLVNFDASNNQFTGPIPSVPFMIDRFQSFAAVSNCFTGSLPKEICSATSLLTLALDGLRSASNCQNRFFPDSSSIKSYWVSGAIEGKIPECLFELPLLNILHLSGNGFSGSLSGHSNLGKDLNDLSLSNNNLKGTIPDVFQNRIFSNLDLSFNKLDGTVSENIPSYSMAASLSLQVNRLSGNIPASLQDAYSISILNGNLFGCDDQRKELPLRDPDSHDYECGSNTFNYSMYVWIGMFGVLNLVGVVLMGFTNEDTTSTTSPWMIPFRCHNEVGGSVMQLGHFLKMFRTGYSTIAAFVVCIVLPVNSILSVYFSTYSDKYAWTITSAYLSGVGPSVTVLVVVVLLVVVAFVLRRRFMTSDVLIITLEPLAARYAWKHQMWIMSILFLNLMFVLGLNLAYVYIHNTYESTIVQTTQICVSLFKIVWNNFVIRVVLKLCNDDRVIATRSIDDLGDMHTLTQDGVMTSIPWRRTITLGVVVMLFNNLAAPFIATALISSNCFYEVITTPAEVEVSYLYSVCQSYMVLPNGNSQCSSYVYGTDVRSTSYIPPFNYSYQCSSTFITTYSAIYIFMMIFIGFVAPAYKLVLLWFVEGTNDGWMRRLAVGILPNILKPFDGHDMTRSLRTGGSSLFAVFDAAFAGSRMFDCDVFVVQLMNLLALLLTFGVVVPPLAIVGAITVYFVSYFSQWCIGRYVQSIRGRNKTSFNDVLDGCLEEIEADCSGASQMLRDSLWLLIPVLALFYSYFLFDMLGDDVGWEQAIWLPISVVIIVVLTSLVFGRRWLKICN